MMHMTDGKHNAVVNEMPRVCLTSELQDMRSSFPALVGTHCRFCCFEEQILNGFFKLTDCNDVESAK